MRLLFIGIFLVVSFVMVFGCKPKEVVRETGIRDDVRGLVIVASFNSRHDALINGYRILNVAVVNNSPKALKMDPAKDVWLIFDSQGRSYQGTNSLDSVDPKAWFSIPYEAQAVLEYPNLVFVNQTVSFGLFFRRGVDLNNFQRISFYSSSLDAEINGSRTNDISPK